MAAAKVLFEKRRDGVAEVVSNRPEVLNALDQEAEEALGRIWDEAASDPDVRVVLISGAGPRAFCAGSDIKEMARTGRSVSTEVLIRALPGASRPFDKPVIAAIHGHCIGMGLTLASHCDLRIASRDARFGFPEARHGMISAVSAARMPRLLPVGWALELLLLGETISAQEALRMGLINRVATGDPREEAERWAVRIAGYPPTAVQATKRLAHLALRDDMQPHLARIDEARREVEASRDFSDGARAFTEQRSRKPERGPDRR